jgi:hypothetical protein
MLFLFQGRAERKIKLTLGCKITSKTPRVHARLRFGSDRGMAVVVGLSRHKYDGPAHLRTNHHATRRCILQHAFTSRSQIRLRQYLEEHASRPHCDKTLPHSLVSEEAEAGEAALAIGGEVSEDEKDAAAAPELAAEVASEEEESLFPSSLSSSSDASATTNPRWQASVQGKFAGSRLCGIRQSMFCGTLLWGLRC